jgi:hypothetical protein
VATTAKPWTLTTPSGQGEFQAYEDEKAAPRLSLSRSERQSCATTSGAWRTCAQC